MQAEDALGGNGELRNRAISRLAGFAELEREDIESLTALAGPVRQFKRGDEIRAVDDEAMNLHLLIDGWAATAIALANGSRQLTATCLPGDILGLAALAVASPIDSVVALTPVAVCEIAIGDLAQLFATNSRLFAIMFLVSQEERSLAMERLALMGQASARTRLAALFIRLHERHSQLVDNAPLRFFMPLTQQELGDLIGVSAVHMNGLIKEFRTSNLITLENRTLTIHDHRALLDIAGVSAWRRSDPAWLPG